MSSTISVIMTSAGPQVTTPATLNTNLINYVATQVPDYTVLPAGLIEDLSSTATGALVAIDQARVDSINSITPLGANAFVLAQQGQMFGLAQGVSANASVYVQFSGSAGYVLPAGFTVSDGTYQYVLQDGGVISPLSSGSSTGSSALLYAVCTSSDTFSIPANTVTQVITSVQAGYTVTVTNPSAGTPLSSAETVPTYRSRVLGAFSMASTGTPANLKTLLYAITGVQQRLVSIAQVTGGWKVICGGGDSYAVANAILKAVPDISALQESSTSSRNISVSLYDQPDTYNITFVNPAEQIVTVSALWNTTLTNFTASTTVNQLGAAAIQNYINSIYVGNPINLLELTAEFQTAISSALAPVNLTTLEFTVTINGSTATPSAGTSIITSDSESYFYCSSTGATVAQG